MTTKITDKNISSIANLFVSWQSVITADGSTTTTGVAGRGYFINTTSAAHTFTLPTIATAGDTILIKDYAGTFASNKLTIDRNGHNIQGVANNSLIGTNRASVTLVYIDATRGWEFVKESNVAELVPTFIIATGGTITTDGDFKVHSFTGDGCFVVSSVGNPLSPAPERDSVHYLVVAGGGSGANNGAGGGGAGGFRTSFPGGTKITTPATTYPVTVGAGGAAISAPFSGAEGNGNSGSPSIFSTITSAGGGFGTDNNAPTAAGSGGSGGGSGSSTNNTAGTGNSPVVSPPQGNPGGTSLSAGPGFGPIGGGGGGADAVGSNASPTAAGAGGSGTTSLITGSSVTFSGGGGGSGDARSPKPAGAGGTGGGGAGSNTSSPAISGLDNTGGGGGGASFSPAPQGTSGAGGKGIVVIRYKFQ